jgi:hypothetical protein
MNLKPPRGRDRSLSEPIEETSEQFATARAVADRWACHVDTVYTRLAAAGVRQYRFSSRLIRWRWTDIFAFEDALAETQPHQPLRGDDATAYKPRKKGPQGLPMKVSTDE